MGDGWCEEEVPVYVDRIIERETIREVQVILLLLYSRYRS